MDDITEFQGEWRFLSNFHPCKIIFRGEVWPTAEHLYQAMKTEDMALRGRIRSLPTPGQAKRAGAGLPLRLGWEARREGNMRHVLDLKFAPSTEMAERLLSTGTRRLSEGNRWHDRFWGRCLCPLHKGEGFDLLGTLLMEIRWDLRKYEGLV